MSQPYDTTPEPSANPPKRPSGRYRFCGGRALDPDAGVHPEMIAANQPPQGSGGGVPNSPEELMAMQQNKPERPEKPERGPSPKVKQVLDLLNSLETTAGEDQQVALAIIRHLEQFHDNAVTEMQEDQEAKHSQIVAWAVDADRLYRCRMLLESVDLE